MQEVIQEIISNLEDIEKILDKEDHNYKLRVKIIKAKLNTVKQILS